MLQKLILPIILQILASIVIIAEFILPSAGILTVSALLLLGYSIFIVFTNISTFAGVTFIIVDLIIFPVLVLFGIKILSFMPVTLKKTLGGEDGETAQSKKLDYLKGLSGNALTDLHPSGTVIINKKRVDVISDGEFIEKGSTILVSKVDGNRVVVKRTLT